MPKLSDMDLLARLDSLPDLLRMATELQKEPSDNVYAIQDDLQQQHRLAGKPFHWSMPFRHLAICPECGALGADIQHELEDPRPPEDKPNPWRVSIWEEGLHAVREHGATFDEDMRRFLEHLD